jgi:hypothetical protein
MAVYALGAVKASWFAAVAFGLLSAVGFVGAVALPTYSLIQIQKRLGEWRISSDRIVFTPLIGRKKIIVWNDLQSHRLSSSFHLSGDGKTIAVPLELIGSAKDDVKKALLRICAESQRR